MNADLLDVVLAAEARALWAKAVRPVARGLGFKPGTLVPWSGRGWVKQTPDIRAFFKFQIDQKFGFDRHMGGRFVVEFLVTDLRHHKNLWDRMWRLLDGASRNGAIEMNNDVIESLPRPPHEILAGIPGHLRPYYLANFQRETYPNASNEDVWFRYATSSDARRWGSFIAAHLPEAVSECETRLTMQPPGTSSMAGHIVKPSAEV